MKKLRLVSRTLALLPALILPFCTLAQGPEGPRGPGAPGGGGGRGGEQHSPLQKEMEAINRNARLLSRQYSDPAKKDSSLDLVKAMQKSAETAKGLTPEKAEKLSGAEKDKYMNTYNKDMDALNKELAALKDAVEGGQSDQIKAELDKINQLKNSSHKELGVQMGGPGGGRGGPGGPGGQQRRPGPPQGGPEGAGQPQSPQTAPAASPMP